MPSIPAKIAYGLLRLIDFKNLYVKRIVTKPPRSNPSLSIPFFLRSGIRIEEHWTDDRRTLTVIPKQLHSDQHIIYYHGGHYVNELELGMCLFAVRLAKKAGVKISITDYPLAPEHNYVQVHDWAKKNYYQLINHYGGTSYLMGDSAGGGLALAMAQHLKQNNQAILHKKLLLLCPWIDMSDFGITEQDNQKDLILQSSVMKIAADWYRAGEDLTNPLLSPIHGELKDVGDIAVWYGTEEVIAQSIKRLEQNAQKQQVALSIYRGEGQHHEYFLLPTPEQMQVIKQIMHELSNGQLIV